MSGAQGGPDAHQALTELVGAARDQFGGELSPRQQAGLVRFEQAVARRTLRSGGRARQVVLVLGLAGAAAVALLTLHRRDGQLTFSVENGTVSDDGYVRAKGKLGTELRFSEGSTFRLDPGTRTRVTGVDAHGGRVLLESGRAHVRVTHLPAAHWTVEAGPYTVRVIGTEFDVRWSGPDDLFDLQVQRGKITVHGPLATEGLTMEAGQRLVANVKGGEMILYAAPGAEGSNPGRAGADAAGESAEPKVPATTADATTPKAAPSVAVATLPQNESRGRTSAARSALQPPALNASWSKMIAQGDFQGVLANAEQEGLARTLDTASVSELNALADAARYVRRNDVARRTLLAVVDRFPHSGTARDAAFFLGGLAEEESGLGGTKAALDWYQRYMAESPGGTYAPQALGRQMLLVHKLRGAAAARPIAADYLQRFPSGPYAAPAKKLLQD
ncbi:MAG TPA: FecR domain-containing protein [Polyangia bacterium]|nr:FecR domain-containing protein [Polyangia bacterium]